MAKCLNCGTVLSCGCQKRKASDGKSVCKACIGRYEQSLKKTKKARNKAEATYNGAPIILSVTAKQKD